MFTYLHCYMPQTWEAQVRAGLVRPGDGIRFSQSLDIEEEMKFNRLAQKGGALYQYVKEHCCPFYIDRLQGGCFLEEYPYDMELVNEYRRLLGDKFWGFQMHEWGSNMRSDFEKITSNQCPEWTAEAITETIRRAYPYEHTFLEAMNAEEYAALGGVPENYGEYLSVMEKLFAKRQEYVSGDLLPCDSFLQAEKLEVDAGAKRLMPEIGAQTPNTRIQVAYARGMARAAGIPFGTYYEPWGGTPFSACCYQREGKNEWNISAESFPYQTSGDNGGSSRSMQWRMHLYSYMAGASFMAEEWGMCNTFYDWENFVLSPYGQVKKDFLDFVDRYPELGAPVVPVAVVLPKEMKVLDMALAPDRYLRYPVEEGRFGEALAKTSEALNYLFVESSPMLGTETINLLNYLTPDAVDIIHEDSPTVGEYPILVDCTANPDFAAAHPSAITPLGEVRQKLNALLPVQLEGGASMQITRNAATGEQYLLLLNNSGVHRTVADGEILLPEGEICVKLTLTDGVELCPLEGNGSATRVDGKTYQVVIPSGGWLFAKL
ncbi:MAG: hypothetical protein E7486_04960 [Ruminococcaceae bacterium]|nr:hypothetical protein [Oscillospiraceae bacterium]